MFLDPSQRHELEQLIPATPRYALPWRWIFAAALILVMACIAAL